MDTVDKRVNPSPIPVSLIGGFLGAGKTTLLNRLLARTTQTRFAVLVNDFGALDIDSDLIIAHGGDTVSLANGCLCCSIGDSLISTLARLLARSELPQHIVIETSGVADPGPIGEVARLDPELTLNATLVVVDTPRVRAQATDEYLEDTLKRQLRAADILLLNKADLINEAELHAVNAWCANAYPTTPVVPCVKGDVPIEWLLGNIASVEGTRNSFVSPHHDIAFWCANFTNFLPIERYLLERALQESPKEILRAKGFISLTDDPQPQALQWVGRRLELTQASHAPPSKLVIIGCGPPLSPEGLIHHFCLRFRS